MHWILIYTLYIVHVKEGQYTSGLLLAIIFSWINELVSKQIVVLCWWGGGGGGGGGGGEGGGVAKGKKKTRLSSCLWSSTEILVLGRPPTDS